MDDDQSEFWWDIPEAPEREQFDDQDDFNEDWDDE